MVDESSARPTRVFTIHNNVLYIDPASSQLRHGPVGSSPANAGIVSDGDHVQLVYEAAGLLKPLRCLPDRCQPIDVLSGHNGRPATSVLEVIRRDGDWVALKTEGHFLRAEPDGRVFLSQGECGACEIFTLAKQPHSREVFDALGLMTPHDIVPFNKKRVGWARDGGYVLLDDFDDVGAVYSIGIGGQVSFDETLANVGKHIFMFDHTIERLPVEHANFHFFREGVGAANDEAAAIFTLENLVRRHGHAGRADLLLKMDVEGAELDIFPAVSRETLRHFRQIVFEVHGLLGLGDPAFRAKFVAALSRINSEFTLFHVHANNYGNIGFVDGFAVADVIELSYVRSDLVEKKISTGIYPTPIDFPNRPQRPDHLLWFYPFLPVGNAANGGGFLKSIGTSNRVLRGDHGSGADGPDRG
jgi:hypothetical protein